VTIVAFLRRLGRKLTPPAAPPPAGTGRVQRPARAWPRSDRDL